MILSTFILALLVGLGVMPLVIRWAARQQWYDAPDARKLHQGQISALGGVGVLVAWLAGSTWMMWTEPSISLGLLPAAGVLWGVSWWDDRYQLSPWIRLATQLAVSLWLVQQGLVLPMTGGYPLSVFLLMLLINAYNLIDGINGLSGTLGLLASLSFGVYFAQQEMWPWAACCLAYAGAVVAFLRHNFGLRAQIFLGDNGATVMGLVLGAAFIRIMQGGGAGPQAPGYWAALPLLLPLVDLMRVAGMRVLKGRSPFSADRTHFHHLLVDKGWSAPAVCGLVIWAHGLGFAALSIAPGSWHAWLALWPVVFLYAVALAWQYPIGSYLRLPTLAQQR